MAATLCGRLLPKAGWLPLTQSVRHGSKAVTRHRKPVHFLKQKLLAVTEYIPPTPAAPPAALAPRVRKTEEESPLAVMLRKNLETLFKECKMIAVVQNNAINAEDLLQLKHKLKKHNISIKFFPNQVTRSFLNNSIYSNMLPLFVGQTVIFVSKEPKVKEMLQALRHSPQMVLIGACIENTLLSYQGILKYSKLPSMTTIQGEIVGGLTMMTSQTVSMLRHHPAHLSALLQQYVKQQGTVDATNAVTNKDASTILEAAA
ncbi:39S ribosomal protein L10, mitochondrial [Pimephales promelas]|uniref:39S ribosomal protein L10, mitochondrial n=1 Tax=Pimephales promelas TaxID=90988 RepID=UPI001955E97F|nr:39S ribosomal protein L10, mitochondrial [Pimephales promelas]KAG1954842.1 39S ribosomal protein L10, mitochondrial [Pimephales promelas]